MANLAENLNLDPDLVERVSEARMGYARAMSKKWEESLDSPGEDLRPWIASEFVRAASIAALWNPDVAMQGFLDAARIYRALENDFSIVLAICGGAEQLDDGSDVRDYRLSDHKRDRGLSRALLEYHILAKQPAPYDGFRRFITDVEPVLDRPVSRFEIPLRDILASLDEAASLLRTDDRRMNSTLGCMRRMNEPLSHAMSDRYHWQRLQSPVLPIEPEFLAYCVVLMRHFMAADRSAEELESRVFNAAPAMSPTLDAAANIAYSGGAAWR